MSASFALRVCLDSVRAESAERTRRKTFLRARPRFRSLGCARGENKSKDASGRGRKRTPEVLKAIEACLRVLRDEETGKLLFRRADVADMTEEQQARADAALKSLEKRVAELRRVLG